VKPLYEKGKRICISDYRPVTLLTSFPPKKFEKVLCSVLLRHVNDKNMLVEGTIWIYEKSNNQKTNLCIN
jgi:hypothetical protein